jgi:threonylcarbamoyladenosine tRNA methylthiotransferase MtaB
MPQLDHATIRRRAAELRSAIAHERKAWLASLLGHELEVLAERDGTGHAPNFARVQLPEGTPAGSLARITPNRIVEGMLA